MFPCRSLIEIAPADYVRDERSINCINRIMLY